MSSRSSKKTSSERYLPGTVEVGRIRRSHGVRGEVVVESFSDAPDRFAVGRELLVSPAADARGAVRLPGAQRRLTVASLRPHKGALLVGFEGIESRDDADALRGALLEVERSQVPEPPEGTYYYFELVGCRVRDVREGDLGEVADVIEDGGGVLLAIDLVAGNGERRLLVPFVRTMVRSVDTAGGVIELELPEGLVEACVSRS